MIQRRNNEDLVIDRSRKNIINLKFEYPVGGEIIIVGPAIKDHANFLEKYLGIVINNDIATFKKKFNPSKNPESNLILKPNASTIFAQGIVKYFIKFKNNETSEGTIKVMGETVKESKKIKELKNNNDRLTQESNNLSLISFEQFDGNLNNLKKIIDLVYNNLKSLNLAEGKFAVSDKLKEMTNPSSIKNLYFQVDELNKNYTYYHSKFEAILNHIKELVEHFKNNYPELPISQELKLRIEKIFKIFFTNYEKQLNLMNSLNNNYHEHLNLINKTLNNLNDVSNLNLTERKIKILSELNTLKEQLDGLEQVIKTFKNYANKLNLYEVRWLKKLVGLENAIISLNSESINQNITFIKNDEVVKK